MAGDRRSLNPFEDWGDRFYAEFVHKDEEHRDDLLFFVHSDDAATENEKYFVRRTETTLPEKDDTNVHWQGTYYLNTVINQYKYHLTVEIMCRKDNSYSSISKKRNLPKIQKQVWASPTKIRMDVKNDEVIQTYPKIFFGVNDFQDAIKDIQIDEEDQLVCVRLIAERSNKKGNDKTQKTTVFSGAIGHSVVRQAYKQEKKVKRSSWWFGGGSEKVSDVFLNMKGPGGVGDAQMAVRPVEKEESLQDKYAREKASSWGFRKLSGGKATPEPTSFNCALTSVTLDIAGLCKVLSLPQ